MKRIMLIIFAILFGVGLLTPRGAAQTVPQSMPASTADVRAPSADAKAAQTTQPATPTPSTKPAGVGMKPAPGKPKEVSVALKGMSVEQVGAFLADQLKKPVLIGEEAKKKKINIISKKKLPLKDAVYLIRQALLDEGLIVEELPALIRIRPVADVMRTRLLRVPTDKSVATVEDKLLIVTKEFAIRHYNVGKMVEVLKPSLSSFGHIMADPDTRKLQITDTVANLLWLEQLVPGIDSPMAEQTLTKIFKLEHEDATEVIAIVRWLIAGRMGINVTDITTASGAASGGMGRPSPSRGGRPGMHSRPSPSHNASAIGASVTQIEPSKTPVTLMPHVSRNWIIAVAPAEIMAQIEVWVKTLDKPREAEKEYELYDVQHADVNDVASQINQTLQSMPSAELKAATHVVPFGQSKKLIVFGSKSGREMVKTLLDKLDIKDAEKRKVETIKLKHADAEEMAGRIETLFSAMQVSYKGSYGSMGSYTSYRRDPNAIDLTVVPDKRLNSITVITDPKTLEKIKALITAEDVEVDVDTESAKPHVRTLRYIDPVEMKDLLDSMFGDKWIEEGSWYDRRKVKVKGVGRLTGQFAFQVLSSANAIVVNSSSPENYKLIDAIIDELDQPQKAGLPLLVELEHANAEDLCEQLNALLAEPHTLASIRRAERGLTDELRSNQDYSEKSSTPDANKNKPSAADMPFWWQSYTRPAGQVATSGLIGKFRIVPVYRRNALLVLAPEGYKEHIEELIEKLDQPGRQVIIRARIGEIQHEDQTTLGLRIASGAGVLAPAGTALGGSASAVYSEVFAGDTLTIGANVNINALLNLLIREYSMKVLLEPTITTSDNEASEYFDGQELYVAKGTRDSAEGTVTRTDLVERNVGTTLRVRPHVTRNNNVDLVINLEISRIVPGSTSQGNPVFDRREVRTHITVPSGRTIMLSGIIRQEKFDDIRKVPLLGDIPLLGKLFRHIDKGVRNREMVIFITPHVMNTPGEVDTQMKESAKTLKHVEEALNGKKQDKDTKP